MAGFTGLDQRLNQMSALGKQWTTTMNKQFNPTLAAVANEWHTFFRGGGNPQADSIFDVGTNLQFQSVCDQLVGAGVPYHGGNVGAAGDDYKVLVSAMLASAAATVVPMMVQLIDVLAFYRVTTVTTTTAQATVASNTFTASSDAGNLLLTYANDWQSFTKVRFTTGGTLPTGLALATDYWLVRQSATTARVATSFANAIAGTVIVFTDAGTGTHTLTCRLPRFSDGVGVEAMFFNPAATALGAATPNLLIGYTNGAGVAGRATPTTPSAPIGKTAASNSIILYSGATGAGKFGPAIPLQGADTGVRSIETIQNSTSYVSGTYTVALYKKVGVPVPIQVLGQGVPYVFSDQPRVFDGAALYLLGGSGVGTPINAAVQAYLNFGWSS